MPDASKWTAVKITRLKRLTNNTFKNT